VLIPLLITFLSVLQISTGVMGRAVATNVVQGQVAKYAIDGTSVASSTGTGVGASGVSTDVIPSVFDLSLRQIELPGGGSFVIGTQRIHQVAVSPLLSGGDNYEATGIAISEQAP
jgi:hypothetical protein